MRTAPPPPIELISEDRRVLVPPQPPFAADGDQPNTAPSHSRNTSLAAESPPITPRSLSFSAINPFSPPSSVISFGGESAPRSGMTSRSTSIADLPRMSSFYGSRPSTADNSSSGLARYREAFSSPPSRPVTIYSEPSRVKLIKERPKSTMLSQEDVRLQKPWLASRDPMSKIATAVTYAVMFLGVIAGALKCYFDWRNVPVIPGNLCIVMDESFDNPDEVFGDNGNFFREVDMSGFGNNEFQMTTASPNNSFVQNGYLYILPTLTSDSVPMEAILNGSVYNITDCTFNITEGQSYTGSSGDSQSLNNTSEIGQDVFDAAAYYKACSAVSNATTGQIINPVQSARLSTRRTASIKYGKVEVRAKIPTGDWLWPAIWMMPVDNVYGSWPLSGEIDIMESRGNSPSYPNEGTDFVRGSLNWGPTIDLNAGLKTTGPWKLRRGSYDQAFHTYTLEWTENFMRMSVDSRLHHLLDLRIKKSFWDVGDFPGVIHNGTDGDVIVLDNPWINGTKNAPFDQSFYLILDIGVGGTNGWFPDGSGGKPWLDGSATAMRDFLLAQDQWYPTWPQDLYERAFVIDSVKMWQQC